uniref:Uncharacterized protein n=1 Tax=Vespula pensylvanica TaxID=30213 RepID=A0A834PF74_VESPE|nr:hypothetical protein H0235_000926 [Vespula pensylvanica]
MIGLLRAYRDSGSLSHVSPEVAVICDVFQWVKKVHGKDSSTNHGPSAFDCPPALLVLTNATAVTTIRQEPCYEYHEEEGYFRKKIFFDLKKSIFSFSESCFVNGNFRILVSERETF